MRRTRSTAPLRERLTSRLDVQENGCWLYTGHLDKKGYGIISRNGKNAYAHKIAYEHWLGPVPEGLELDHTCHDATVCKLGNNCPHRRCCNPFHLSPVTHQVNSSRMWRHNNELARAATHCKRGHEFTSENTYQQRNNRRGCKACKALKSQEAEQRRKLRWLQLGNKEVSTAIVRPSRKVLTTHCKRGHQMISENVYWQRGRRVCRLCRVITNALLAAKRKEAA